MTMLPFSPIGSFSIEFNHLWLFFMGKKYMFVFCFLVKKNSKFNVCEGCKQMVSLTRPYKIMTDEKSEEKIKK